MKVIGLTGGIGSGKSTVSAFLAELGAAILDTDKIGHEVLQPGHEVFKRVVKEFGSSILTSGGEIDRARLGELVFHDDKARERLENIMHPEIDKILLARLAEYRQKGVKVAVLEAAVLLESGKTWQVDEIWATVAPRPTVLRRLKGRPKLSEAEARKRISSQMSNEERIKKADVVINTDCTLDELKARVTDLWQRLLKQDNPGY